MRVALVACASQKLAQPAAARDLYVPSDLFAKARAYVEAAQYDRWYILSAKHYLVDPHTVLQPYDTSLNGMTATERRWWSIAVRHELVKVFPQDRTAPIGERLFREGPHVVDLFAGALYREHLEQWLRDQGVTVNVPLEGLGIGQQKRWLLQQTRALEVKA